MRSSGLSAVLARVGTRYGLRALELDGGNGVSCLFEVRRFKLGVLSRRPEGPD